MTGQIIRIILQLGTLFAFGYGIYKNSKRKKAPTVEVNTQQVSKNIGEKEQNIKDSGDFHIFSDIDVTVRPGLFYLVLTLPLGILSGIFIKNIVTNDNVVIKFFLIMFLMIVGSLFLQFLILSLGYVKFNREGVEIKSAFKRKFYEYKDVKITIQEKIVLHNVDMVCVIYAKKDLKSYEFSKKVYPTIINEVKKLSNLGN